MEPLVSIITPMYNSEKFISGTIESVQAQTYKNWEMIIIDDCSTDSSAEIVKKYADEDRRIKYIKNGKNSGPATSRNNGIEKSKGEYIAFLDADDLWFEDKLKKQISFMKKNNIKMSHGNYYFGDESGKVIKEIEVTQGLEYKTLLKNNQIKTSFLVVSKDAIEGLYFPKIRHEDFAFFLDIMRKGIESYSIDGVLGIYRINNLSVSSNKLKSAIWTWNIYRDYEKFNLVKAGYYFSWYVLTSLMKYKK